MGRLGRGHDRRRQNLSFSLLRGNGKCTRAHIGRAFTSVIAGATVSARCIAHHLCMRRVLLWRSGTTFPAVFRRAVQVSARFFSVSRIYPAYYTSAMSSQDEVARTVPILVSGTQVAQARISLTSSECAVFQLLHDMLSDTGSETIVRAAGGWVRDKLLGRPTHDLDLAVDNMSGVAFAEALQAWQVSQGMDTKRIATIEANPEQSKHLEAATTTIHAMSIDIVNLRAEEYSSDSRIPTIRYGTPTEDAERRDFTINALFFNVNTGSIEDFTGQGFTDLQHGIIRTPLAPRQTLLDDPLRVLRAVRFAARYGFSVEPTLWAGLQDPEVREALGSKVSRERVGGEVWSMLTCTRPTAAASMLVEFGLLRPVLSPPPIATAAELLKVLTAKSKAGPSAAARVADDAAWLSQPPYEDSDNVPDVFDDSVFSQGGALLDQLHALCAALAQARHTDCTPAPVAGICTVLPDDSGAESSKRARLATAAAPAGHGAASASAAAAVAADSTAEPIAADAQPQTKPDWLVAGAGDASAAQIAVLLIGTLTWWLRGWKALVCTKGKTMRAECAVQETVRSGLKLATAVGKDVVTLHACAFQLVDWLSSAPASASSATDEQRLALGQAIRTGGASWRTALLLALAVHTDSAAAGVATHGLVLECAEAWRIADAWAWKPILNGKQLQALGVPRGPTLGTWVAKVMEWQLLHPAADEAAAMEAVRAELAAAEHA